MLRYFQTRFITIGISINISISKFPFRFYGSKFHFFITIVRIKFKCLFEATKFYVKIKSIWWNSSINWIIYIIILNNIRTIIILNNIINVTSRFNVISILYNIISITSRFSMINFLNNIITIYIT